MFANQNQPRPPGTRSPGLIELVPHPLADRLYQQAHRLAGDREITLRAQNVLLAREPLDRADQRVDIAHLRKLDDDRDEIIMLMRLIAIGYAVALGFAALLNYIPGLTDAQGRSFGIFELDIYDDMLHVASAAWAAIAAYWSRQASINFLKLFGTLYCLDGLMGLAIGSGYLDLGIVFYGVQNLPIGFKILANLPHIALGGFAIFTGFVLAKRQGTHSWA